MLETRDITVNGAVRTAFHESIFTVSIAPGNVRIVRLLFGNEALNVQLEGACPDYGDIQEISGSPLERGGFEKQWDGFRYYLCKVQSANLEPSRLKAWGGISKMESGLELKVVYWFTALTSEDELTVHIPRVEKQNMDFCMGLNRKEEEERALVVDREKADIALLQAQTEAVKQPAAAAKQVIALKEKLARAEEASAATLEEALKKWMRFNPPGMGANTKARIEKAVHFYITDPDKRSLSKIAAEFDVSRPTVSRWFRTFTDKTGFAVVTHRRNKSVRDQTFSVAEGTKDDEGEAN